MRDGNSHGKQRELFLSLCQSLNKQLQRTVIGQHGRAASASFHCALAARFARQRAAAELRRCATSR
jgi:hypothetical protein